ncbi:MAG: GlmU family protein [Bacteroidota bacterium]
MQYVLCEDSSHFDLLPLTFTRPVWDLRVGIDTLGEKWQRCLNAPVATTAYAYLQARFQNFNPQADSLLINGKFIPGPDTAAQLAECAPGQFVLNEYEEVQWARCRPAQLGAWNGLLSTESLSAAGLKPVNSPAKAPAAIRYPWDIFRKNGECLRADFAALTAGRKSAPIDDRFTAVYGRDNIFLEEGVELRANVLNADAGPIYLGKGVKLGEGAMLHGAHALLPYSSLSMGAKMRGDTTVGPGSKIGGEVGNSVIQGYSNKGHDGYLGNSVLGHWCNLGADTNTSNLKNNYSQVRVWNYPSRRFTKTGDIFCGLIMGDHSKCGINTMFNTGTVVGVSANVFGAGYPRNFIPSFSWGGPGGLSTYRLPKVYEVAKAVMSRRNRTFDEPEAHILQSVFELTAEFRSWDKADKPLQT